MSDTLMMIIAIGVAVVLIVLVPLMSVAERNDDIAIGVIQTATTEFANNVASKGKITEADYDAFIQKIEATGIVCDVEVEIQHLDENPGKKPSAVGGNLKGENLYYSTWDVDEKLADKHIYLLKKGDNIVIKVSKQQATLAESLSAMIYKVLGKNTDKVIANSTAGVVNSGS